MAAAACRCQPRLERLARDSIRARKTDDMRAVMPVALPEVLRLRKQTGADRFDEMWEGVLHMRPAPSFDHQNTASGICAFFREVRSEERRVGKECRL